MLAKIRSKSSKFHTLLHELRASENSFEHYLQLIVLILILLCSKTSSPIISGFNKVFLDEATSLVYVSAIA